MSIPRLTPPRVSLRTSYPRSEIILRWYGSVRHHRHYRRCQWPQCRHINGSQYRFPMYHRRYDQCEYAMSFYWPQGCRWDIMGATSTYCNAHVWLSGDRDSKPVITHNPRQVVCCIGIVSLLVVHVYKTHPCFLYLYTQTCDSIEDRSLQKYNYKKCVYYV